MRAMKIEISPVFLLVLVVGCLTLSCRREPTPSEPPPASEAPPPIEIASVQSTNLRTFYVKGVIKAIDQAQNEVTVKHEEVPGFMPAMTMPFEVKDQAELDGLAVDDEIVFRMLITPDEGWIDEVTKTGTAPAEPEPTFRRVRLVDPVEVGDAVPNYPLTNQLGQPFSLSELQGEALAMTFIYTRCPYPNFCPRMSGNFSKTLAALQADAEAPQNWHLLTVTIDPEYDTPEVLAAYAKEQPGFDPKKWTFATGAMIEIDALTEQFGLSFGWAGEVIDHNVRTVVVGPRGKVRNIILGNDWEPEELVSALIAAAQGR